MSYSRQKPNFFILGAPKCGTTAMSEYLRAHPNIFMCLPKEPHYFSTDFPRIRCVQTESQYLSLFKGADPFPVVGEASASYLYSSTAIQQLYEFNPQARLLVMLRNPIDMVYSLHSEFLFNGYEVEQDFGKAWILQQERRQGLHIPKACLEPLFLSYRQHAAYPEQLIRLFSYFPKEQVNVVLFDDFISDTLAVYEAVLSFLALPSDGRERFPKVNANKQARSHWSDRPLSAIRPFKSQWYPWVRTLKSLVGLSHVSMTAQVASVKRETVVRSPMSPSLRNQLIDTFKPDTIRLSKILDRDLSNWSQL